MYLEWRDHPGIAQALKRHHPDTNFLTLTEKDLIRMVSALPTFRDDPRGPGTRAALYAIQDSCRRLCDAEVNTHILLDAVA